MTQNFKPSTNHSSSQKTKLNDLSYGVKNLDRSFFRFVTIHAFDRRTDGQTDSFLLVRPPCIQCSAVKIGENLRPSRGCSLRLAPALQLRRKCIERNGPTIICECRHYITVAEVAVVFFRDVDVVVYNVMVVAVIVIAVFIVVLLVSRVVVYLVMLVDEARSNHFQVTETQLLQLVVSRYKQNH